MSFRRKKDGLEFPFKKIECDPQKAREFARRMIIDGIMSPEQFPG